MDALRTGDMEVMIRKLDHGFLQHLRRDHIPYRRDCRACFAGYFRGHVHRRVAVPDGWCLSLDLIGPFKEGENEDGTKAKYGLVGVLVVPDILDETRLDLVDPGEVDRDLASGGEEPDENPLHQEEDKEEEDGDDDFSSKDVAAELAEKMKWEALAEVDKVHGAKSVEVPFFVPLKSKKAPVVLKGVAEMVMQIQILGLTVRRIHSDRGREFNNEALKKFVVRDVGRSSKRGHRLLRDVDDLLIAGVPGLAQFVGEMFQKQWKCTTPEWLSAGEVKFNGFELCRMADGTICAHQTQSSYVQDFLNRHLDVDGYEDVPAPPVTKFDGLPAASFDDGDMLKVKEAQGLAGELQWLCGRCRPEISYAVNIMAQAISRSPMEAVERGRFGPLSPTLPLCTPQLHDFGARLCGGSDCSGTKDVGGVQRRQLCSGWDQVAASPLGLLRRQLGDMGEYPPSFHHHVDGGV